LLGQWAVSLNFSLNFIQLAENRVCKYALERMCRGLLACRSVNFFTAGRGVIWDFERRIFLTAPQLESSSRGPGEYFESLRSVGTRPAGIEGQRGAVLALAELEVGQAVAHSGALQKFLAL
jgi:hypothetical protein